MIELKKELYDFMKDNEGLPTLNLSNELHETSEAFENLREIYNKNDKIIDPMTPYTCSFVIATLDYIRHHGYKLEEQKLYYLELLVTSFPQINRFVNLEKAENSVFIASKLETKSFKTRFTEEEIDEHEILSQYKQFMKEVD